MLTVRGLIDLLEGLDPTMAVYVETSVDAYQVTDAAVDLLDDDPIALLTISEDDE